MSVTIEKKEVREGRLYITLLSDSVEELLAESSDIIQALVQNSNEFAIWHSAGIERSTGPIPFSADDPEADVYKLAQKNKDLKLHYRQTFYLVRPIG